MHPDWTAFPVHEPLADRFLVGYGLDWMERFRGLPFIGTIPRPAPRWGRPGSKLGSEIPPGVAGGSGTVGARPEANLSERHVQDRDAVDVAPGRRLPGLALRPVPEEETP